LQIKDIFPFTFIGFSLERQMKGEIILGLVKFFKKSLKIIVTFAFSIGIEGREP